MLGRSPLRRSRRFATIVIVVAGLGLAGCTSTPADSEPAYGSLPSYLPADAIQPDSILTGTAARPALTTEGDAVDVHLEGGSVRATITGPDVPGEGLPYQGPATTCTWTVTLTDATAVLPIDIADFSSIDHLGTIYHPTTVPGHRPLPTAVNPGQRITFQLRAVMRTGEGLMRWAPSHSILASWDFEVEND